MGSGGLAGRAARPGPVAGRDPALKGMRVLVVEDELLVAMTVEEMLGDLGCVSAGISYTVAAALGAIRVRADIDAAILDVNLGHEQVFPVADELVALGVPFMFSTGFGPADLSHRYPGRPVLYKPYRLEALARMLRDIRR